MLATVYQVYRAAARHSLRVGPFRVDDTVVPAVLLDRLSDDSPASSAQLAATVAALNRAAHGRPARASADLLHALARPGTSLSARGAARADAAIAAAWMWKPIR